MRKLMDTYFAISKREFNGLLALVILIVLIAATPSICEIAEPKEEPVVAPPTSRLPVHNHKKHAYGNKRKKLPDRARPQLFVFDPNAIGADEWQNLGLSVRQSAAILKYRAKGGKFRKAEDLQKMYTISDEMYQQLFPYVKIVEEPVQPAPGKKTAYDVKANDVKPVLSIIEVNSADSITLIEIKGVGPVFAHRILRYRERLGGFYKKEQLMEVFGLDSVKFKEIRDQVMLDTANLRKININAAQIGHFKSHPYISYKQANALIQYQKQHGDYTNIADLSKVLILDAETISRLAPYIKFKQ